MLEKDTNSGLNTMQFRHQEVFVANLYRQDFLWHGYTIQASVHYDKDDAPLQYDGAAFFGVAGGGHTGRLKLAHPFYEVLGNDSLNPIAERPVRINAQMAAAEL